MNRIILYLLMGVLISCKEFRIKHELRKLNLTPIVIPENLICTYNGRDSVFILGEKHFKYIVYVDSTGCNTCNINKMYLWDPILNYVEKYDNIQFYFIFSSLENKIDELKTLLKYHRIDYPVFIDKIGEFEKLNPHLPKNKTLHTFLLDENNKVILVGNPLHNKEIKKLFYQKTQELLSKR